MKVAIKSDKKITNKDRIFIDEILGVYIVADGMGGHKAGNVANTLAAESAYG